MAEAAQEHRIKHAVFALSHVRHPGDALTLNRTDQTAVPEPRLVQDDPIDGYDAQEINECDEIKVGNDSVSVMAPKSPQRRG